MEAKRHHRGLVVGKFSPLHKGHEFLIDTALDACNELVILTYSRPEFASCDAAFRLRWLEKAAPTAKIISVDAAGIELRKAESDWGLSMPHNEVSDESHRNFTAELLKSEGVFDVDAVFTSEVYGDGFAEYLTVHGFGIRGQSVCHKCVDIDRNLVPISASQIRSSECRSDTYLSSESQHEFGIKRICFLGGESTGKSTLSKKISKCLKEPLIEEYGRELWESKSGDLNPDDLVYICGQQIINEQQAYSRARKYVICDTSPVTTLSYSEAMFGTQPDVISAFAERPYHKVFLCADDIPFVQDGTRQESDFRTWQQDWLVRFLTDQKIDYVNLGGSIEDRMAVVLKTLGLRQSVLV